MTKAKKETAEDSKSSTVKTSKSNAVSVVTLWRNGGKSLNHAKTNNLLEALIQKTGLK